jgi:hypothetical protein
VGKYSRLGKDRISSHGKPDKQRQAAVATRQPVLSSANGGISNSITSSDPTTSSVISVLNAYCAEGP